MNVQKFYTDLLGVLCELGASMIPYVEERNGVNQGTVDLADALALLRTKYAPRDKNATALQEFAAKWRPVLWPATPPELPPEEPVNAA